MKKKPRLDPDEDGEGGGLAFSFFGINTSTPRGAGVDMSTPRLEGRSVKKMGGFRALGRVSSDLVGKGKGKEDVEDMEAYLKFDESGEAELDAAHKDDEDATRQPHTPPPRPSSTAPLSPSRNPSFFSHLPLFHPPTPGLPFPLLSTSTPTSRTTSLNTNTMGVEPKTPPSTHTGMGMDEVDTAQYATPRLGEPFKPEMMSPFGPVGPGAGTSASAGGIGRRDRERSDKFNPYYTPGQRRRSSGRSVSMAFSLGSPAPVTSSTSTANPTAANANTATGLSTVSEADEESSAGGGGVEDSPPVLRTLYGTELEGDTRFGDFGRELGLLGGRASSGGGGGEWKWGR
ncbi:hypothetical protein M422DRAFT_783003 [Sphaerobolus stellatus SS14]|uniref:Uncharacterized protein n=1 Tax=Sphaerobolus stellatus (strain SS14) TaxID=990650 RepID=A0A0C9UXR6_SPHS4|nr:hypothetical protein M422DRAFT_783003 [Sphaerobolus stellatus SS14]